MSHLVTELVATSLPAGLRTRLPKRLSIVIVPLAFVTALILYFAFVTFQRDFPNIRLEIVAAEYFQGAFILQIAAIVGWYLVSMRSLPARLAEFKLLLSLPVPHSDVFRYLMISDFLRFSWLGFLLGFLWFAMLSLSSLAFITRPATLVCVAYIVTVSLSIRLQLAAAARGRPERDLAYIVKWHAPGQMISFAMLTVLIVMISFITFAGSVVAFGLFLILSAGLIAFLSISSMRTYESVVSRQLWLKSGPVGKQKTSSVLRRKLLDFGFRYHPLLTKNILETVRSKSAFSIVLMTSCFVAVAYLMAMNNKTIEDATSVLLGINVLYIMTICVRLISQMSPDLEPMQILHGLPVRKRMLLISRTVPALFWSLAVTIALAFLLLLSGADLSAIATFILHSFVAAVSLIVAAINLAVISFPDRKRAQHRFTMWLTLLLIIGAVLYSKLIAVVLVMSALTLLPVFRVRLWHGAEEN